MDKVKLPFDADHPWWYWLPTPSPESSHDALRVNYDGVIDHFNVGNGDKMTIGNPDDPQHEIIRPYGVGGIVPACYLDAKSITIKAGDGSDSNPYILKAAGNDPITYTVRFEENLGSKVPAKLYRKVGKSRNHSIQPELVIPLKGGIQTVAMTLFGF